MTAFLDKQQREWTIELTVPLINEVRRLFGIDLMDVADAPRQLKKDVGTFVDVLYVLCRDQADQRGMTSAQFGESLEPQSLERACDVFCAAVAEHRPAWRKKRVNEFVTDKRPILPTGK